LPFYAVLTYALEILTRGGVIAYPTETFYGLGVNATDEKAIRLFPRKIRMVIIAIFSSVCSIVVFPRNHWDTQRSAVVRRKLVALCELPYDGLGKRPVGFPNHC